MWSVIFGYLYFFLTLEGSNIEWRSTDVQYFFILYPMSLSAKKYNEYNDDDDGVFDDVDDEDVNF